MLKYCVTSSSKINVSQSWWKCVRTKICEMSKIENPKVENEIKYWLYN